MIFRNLLLCIAVLGGTNRAAAEVTLRDVHGPQPPAPAGVTRAILPAVSPGSAPTGRIARVTFAPPALEPLTIGFPQEEEMLASSQLSTLNSQPLPSASYARDWQRASQVPSFSALLTTLAQSMPGTPPSTLGPWLTDLLYVCGIFFFFVGGIEKAVKFFGHKPTFAEEISALHKLIAQAAPLAVVEELRHQVIPRTELNGHLSRQDTETRRLSMRVETVAGLVDEAKKEILAAGEARLARIELRLDTIGDTAAGMRAALEQLNRDHHAKK